MNRHLTAKYQHLIAILKAYPNVAVAFSGGVDSTLLGYAACSTHDPERVLILSASSCLLPRGSAGEAKRLASRLFPPGVRYLQLAMEPLRDPAFVANTERRCYICKSTIYSELLSEMKRHGFSVLVDGTNVDDLSDNRPGLSAIRERGVQTPLVAAGFTKADVRSAASHFKLPNARLPSNSCLATRIASGTEITAEQLKQIDDFERFLEGIGLTGCRVRPREGVVLVELAETDFRCLGDDRKRREIVMYFQGKGFTKMYLDLIGRR